MFGAPRNCRECGHGERQHEAKGKKLCKMKVGGALSPKRGGCDCPGFKPK